MLGVRLRGGEGFTRWDKRPLTDKQLSYAADDARCLLALGYGVERELAERGRLEWAREECRLVEESNDVRTPERAYEKLPKLGRLDEQRPRGRPPALRVARGGRAGDGPPALLRDARPGRSWSWPAGRPKDRAALENIRGLPQQTLHRRGAELVEQIARGRDEQAPPAPPPPPKRDPAEAPLVSLAQAVVRHRSRESGVATELIATQSELTALVASVRRGEHADGVRALNGWRRELVGDELRELIGGRRQVSVGAEGELVVVAPAG